MSYFFKIAQKYKICSISVSNPSKGEKSDVNRANIFCRNFKAEERVSVTFPDIFSPMADFRDVVSVLPAARLIKASRISVALQKN